MIISQHFYPEIGSAGNRMTNIFQLLSNEDYDVTILTTDPAYPNRHIYEDTSFWNNQTLNEENANIKRVKSTNRKYSRSFFNRLLFFLEVAFKLIVEVFKDKNKYDVVYVTSPPIFIGIVGLIAKFRFKSKLLLEVRDLWPDSLKGVGVFDSKIILNIFGYIEKILYKKSNALIVNSKGFIDYIHSKANIDREKIVFVPNAARRFEVEPREPVAKKEKFQVIYTGNVGLAQDIEFLKAFAAKLHHNEIPLTIISYGVKNSELKQFVKDEQLQHVSISAPLTREDCLHEIRTHHVGVVSLNDKKVFDTVLPGKVVDYMTCGVPIVGSVAGYAKKVIETNQVGFVSEERNVEEIFEHIQYLKNNPNARDEMAENSRRCICEGYIWEDNIKKIDRLIHEVLI